MSEAKQTDFSAALPLEDLGKSLFPTFAINVPMPSNTVLPMQTPAPSAGTTPSALSTSTKK